MIVSFAAPRALIRDLSAMYRGIRPVRRRVVRRSARVRARGRRGEDGWAGLRAAGGILEVGMPKVVAILWTT